VNNREKFFLGEWPLAKRVLAAHGGEDRWSDVVRHEEDGAVRPEGLAHVRDDSLGNFGHDDVREPEINRLAALLEEGNRLQAAGRSHPAICAA